MESIFPSSLVIGTACTWNSLAVPDFLYNIISTWIRYPYYTVSNRTIFVVAKITLYWIYRFKIRFLDFWISRFTPSEFQIRKSASVLIGQITILKCFTVFHSSLNTMNTLLWSFWTFLTISLFRTFSSPGPWGGRYWGWGRSGQVEIGYAENGPWLISF